MKTVNVKNAFTGQRGSARAYADRGGIVRVLDNIAGHYTTCHKLTEPQIKYFVRMTRQIEED